jgi:hypothetical protein
VLVTRILVATHALFVVLFLIRACGKFAGTNVLQDNATYDIASTTLSVFCKIVLHWLVFSTSPVNSSDDNAASVATVVCMSLVVASMVVATHAMGSGACPCVRTFTQLDEPLVVRL